MNLYFFGSAINISALYMTAGLGAAISIKSGNLNLGGEGQIYIGGFVCAIILQTFQSVPVVLTLPLSLLLAIIASAAIACLCAFFKLNRNSDFLFTSFISSAAIIPVIDGLIAGPFRSRSDNLLSTPFIPDSARFKAFVPRSPLTIMIAITVAFCIFFFFAINRTSYGRKLTIYGTSPLLAEYAGYNEKKLFYSSALISGGMHGLCGALAVLGVYFTCHSGFYQGIGWNSLSAAMIANSNPLLLIPSSLFMGFITTYANKYAMYANFTFDVSGLIQAAFLFIISFPLYTKQNFIKREAKR